jgi:hypothetical protein
MQTPSVIHTPDQRLRVFVSSTLRELAAEREAARKTITGLHLTPVMFDSRSQKQFKAQGRITVVYRGKVYDITGSRLWPE